MSEEKIQQKLLGLLSVQECCHLRCIVETAMNILSTLMKEFNININGSMDDDNLPFGSGVSSAFISV